MTIQAGKGFLKDVFDAYQATHGTWSVHLLAQANAAYTLSYDTVWHSSLDASEATFKGYSSQDAGTPTITWDGTNHWVNIDFTEVSFTYDHTGSGDDSLVVDGWAITNDQSPPIFVCGDVIASPITFHLDGDNYTLTGHIKYFEDATGTPDPA